MNTQIADLRKEYQLKSLDEADTADSPFQQFTCWWQEAVDMQLDEVNFFTLATVNKKGMPTARIMLLKDYNESGFIFYTNYNSNKSTDLLGNPQAAMVFFWQPLERQVRICGSVTKVSDKESETYFLSRPLGSRIGAWSSPQSQPVANRNTLEDAEKMYSEKFGANVPRPPHWGGWLLNPISIEFWQGRPSRLHDRILYSRINNAWKKERLAP